MAAKGKAENGDKASKPADAAPPSRARNVTLFILLALVLIIGLLGWGFLRQIDDARAYRLRTLEQAAATLESLFESNMENVLSLAELQKDPAVRADLSRLRTASALRALPRGSLGFWPELLRAVNEIEARRARTELWKKVSFITSRSPFLGPLQRTFPEAARTRAETGEAPRGEGEASSGRAGGSPRAYRLGSSDVTLDASRRPLSIEMGFYHPGTSRATAAGDSPRTLRFSLDLRAMLDAALPRPETFDYHALVDDRGTVQFQSAPSIGLRWTGSSGEPTANAAGGEDGPGEGSQVGFSSLLATPARETLSSTTNLAGEELEVICQPVRVPTRIRDEVTEEQTVWNVCGAIRVWRARREAIAMAPHWSVGLVLELLLALALLAHAKPYFMERRERLRKGDLVRLITGMMLGFLVLTLLGAAIYHGWRIGEHLDGQLTSLAQQIGASLDRDLHKYRQRLVDLDEAYCAGTLPVAACLRTQLLRPTTQDVARRRNWGLDGPPSPIFRLAFWTDGSGQQIHKVTTDEEITPLVSVARRDYFQKIRRGETWSGGFYVETAWSMTTGEPFFALSRRCGCDRAEVVALTGRLPGMEARVPPPFGFAMIDGEGRIVLTSHQDLRLGGSFFYELDQPQKLRAAMEAPRPTTWLNGRLWRHDHRFRVEAFDTTPATLAFGDRWWLVTFYDRELRNTLLAEALSLALVPLLFYTGLFWIGCALLRHELYGMTWARRRHLPLYLLLAGFYLVYTLGAIVFFSQGTWVTAWSGLDGRAVLASSLLWAVLVVATPLVARRLAPNLAGLAAGPLARERLAPWAHGAVFVLFWVAAAVMPALICFDAAWSFENRSLVHSEKAWRQRQHIERRQQLHREWGHLVHPEDLAERLASHGDRFRLSAATWAADAVPAPPAGIAWLADYLPVYNPTSARLRFQSSKGEAVAAGPDPVGASIPDWSDIGSSGDDGAGTLERLLALGLSMPLALLGIVLWAFVVPENLGLRPSRHADSPPVSLAALLAELDRAGLRRMVILTSPEQWETVAARDLATLDLTIRESGDLGTGGPVAVLGLAEALAESDLRESAIERCHRLLDTAGERGVWIFTDCDPYPVLDAAMVQGVGARESAGILDYGDARRWAALLRDFELVVAAVEPSAGDGQAESLFWGVWWSCSDDERLVMLHLAEEGLLNRHQGAAVESLRRRGLLEVDTDTEPVAFRDPAFEGFVRRHASSRHLLAKEREAGRRGWHALRWAFFLVFSVFFAVLFFTQQQLLQGMTGLIAGIAATVPALVNLVGRLGRSLQGGG